MPFVGEAFTKVVHLEHAGTGNGESENCPLPIAAQDLMTILPGMVITGVIAIVKTAIGTATAVLIGDDDDADGYLADANLTEATPGAYLGNGAYLTGALLAKYYASAGKEVKWAQTGNSSAGKVTVIIKGYKV